MESSVLNVAFTYIPVVSTVLVEEKKNNGIDEYYMDRNLTLFEVANCCIRE